jgi:transketolase
MRSLFNETLLKIAEVNPKVHLIVADIGFEEVERFAERFPDRFVNVGVAEQNMTGVATGIALEGNVAVTYSIANFPILRCLEQIRNDVCYHRANVKIVIIGGGMCYGALGVSHQSTEDLAIMRSLPDMAVVAPADFAEAEAATRCMIDWEGPVFFRCGRRKEPALHAGQIDFRIGRAIQVRDGYDVTLIGTGTVTHRALEATELLRKRGIGARLLSMHTVKPIDAEAILAAARQTRGIVTVEEHNILGGLGGAVAEVLCEAGVGVPFKRIGIPDTYTHVVGSQKWLLDYYGFSPETIASTAEGLLAR